MKLSKAYEPGEFESDIYALWEQSGAFAPNDSDKSYSVVMPPPNANANLHIGYGLTAALEDIAARFHRLKGESVLLLPGADHAGFETQSVYEKHLAKEGKSRFDFSREELYSQIWDFVALNRGSFENQMRQMGVSCDWSRYTFTLDNKIVNRAYATFKKMWDEGLIYRGERLVNFCTFHGTAFADIEVVHTEEAGKLWHIRYPLTDGSGEIVVATTRPETMLGDTAVAVHPDDERYKQLKGKTVRLPLSKREIPIIFDDFVDPVFGTGAVKITPAHDPNDFEAGKRHDLPMITVIDNEGRIIHDVSPTYAGLSVDDARQKIVSDLEEQGYLVAADDHTHSVGHCYKCNTVIQPLLRDQWFVDMQPLAKAAIEALEAKKIVFYPDAKREQLIRYLQGLRDWNISRQIAWGIPIPAFQNVDDKDDWIYDERVAEETITVDGKTYRRDADVFDTWFSSSSWPYATLDYPDGADFKQFYPLSLMETGGEILQPWVSRMIMLGLYITGEVPFKEVYIHGYVMAEDGSKMSKSVGNVVDPQPVIAEYGSDALRLGIINGRQAAVNRGYDQRKVEDGRNFCNKLWNIARYIESVVGDYQQGTAVTPTSTADHWVLSKLQHTQTAVIGYLDTYRFAEAYELLYHFVWDDVADWYIEASKVAPNKPLLAHVLESILRFAHPFAPFVTEAIWQTLAWDEGSVLAKQPFAPLIAFDEQQAADFNEIQTIVTEVRLIATSLKVTKPTLLYNRSAIIETNAEIITKLAKLQAITETENGSGIRLTTTKSSCWLDIDEQTARAYTDELEAQHAKQVSVIKQLEGRLANTSYVQNAPAQIVEQTKTQLSEAQAVLNNIENQQHRFTA